MRRSLAIALTAIVTAFGVWIFGQDTQGPARYAGSLNLPRNTKTLGGFSGLELGPDGHDVTLISDRGHIVQGTIQRAEGAMSGIELAHILPLRDEKGQPVKGKHNDAEGAAFGPHGALFVSFESDHRILAYPPAQSTAIAMPRHPDFSKFPGNGGIEALAVNDQGFIFAIPERVWNRRRETFVYRLDQQGWAKLSRYPRHPAYLPVGADFGPDGRFYVLERHFKGLGFSSQIRSFGITGTDLVDERLILRTAEWRHGNLEGLSVWRDPEGQIRLSMVSDDNFLPFLPSMIVEYVLPKTLAKQGNQD